MCKNEGITLSATFHLTHNCNLNCSYCYTGEKKDFSMTKEIVNKSIDFVLEEAIKTKAKKLNITFFGGEPLLEKQKIFHIINELNRRKRNLIINYQMSTNGLLLTEKTMKLLFEKRVYVSLSIDGTPEINDMNRIGINGKKVSHRMTKAATILLKYNPAANVTCVVTPKTAIQLVESVDWLYALGFRYITTTLDYSANWSSKDFKILRKSYIKLGKWYEKKMINEERFYLSFFDERIRTRTQRPLTEHERCHLGERQFSISPNGDLFPCTQFVQTAGNSAFLLGDIFKGFDKLKRNHLTLLSENEKKECTGCSLESRCSRWCSCINYASTGSIEKVSPVLCHNEQILMKIVDKTADKLWKKRNNMFVHKHYNPDYPIISHIELNL